MWYYGLYCWYVPQVRIGLSMSYIISDTPTVFSFSIASVISIVAVAFLCCFILYVPLFLSCNGANTASNSV